MNDLKHTSGPFTLRKSGHILSGDILIGRAFWNPENPNGIEEAKANGILFAAAPELLDALRYQKRMQDGDASCDLQTFLHLRDSAIAKATGKEPA